MRFSRFSSTLSATRRFISLARRNFPSFFFPSLFVDIKFLVQMMRQSGTLCVKRREKTNFISCVYKRVREARENPIKFSFFHVSASEERRDDDRVMWWTTQWSASCCVNLYEFTSRNNMCFHLTRSCSYERNIYIFRQNSHLFFTFFCCLS